MNRSEYILNLTYLIEKYVVDVSVRAKLISEIKEYDVKYMLSQLDKLKSKEYSECDRNLIKDIFHYG